MVRIIDRRFDSKNKSAVNRQRFMRRFKGQIREAVADAIAGRSIPAGALNLTGQLLARAVAVAGDSTVAAVARMMEVRGWM